MTTLYLIRHSTRINHDCILEYNTTQSDLLKNEKDILSPIGEERAKILSEEIEFANLDKIYVSNCVRTLQTAKYMMEKYNLKVVIDERLDERRVGVPNDKKIPDWFVRQYKEKDYKTVGGESQKDVVKRLNGIIDEILSSSKNQKVAVFSHGYAICFYLLQYCELEYIDQNKNIKIVYKDKPILDGILNAPDVFKLTFNDKELVDIEHLEFADL